MLKPQIKKCFFAILLTFGVGYMAWVTNKPKYVNIYQDGREVYTEGYYIKTPSVVTYEIIDNYYRAIEK